VLAAQGYAVEDTSIALISFANGALACVEESWVLPNGYPGGFDQRLDVLGARGMVSVAGGPGALLVVEEERPAWPDTALWPTVEDGGVDGALERQVRHFLRAVATGGAPLVSGHDGLMAVRMALAAEEAARGGVPVALPREGTDAG
jgi:UDP-N-acetylglucosamine 3-dehydrogenase